MALGYIATSQSSTYLDNRLEYVTDLARTNSQHIGILQEQMKRTTDDIRALTLSNARLAEAMNRFTGIGIAVAAIGAIIILMQAVGIVKKPRS